ncbi:sodium-dependent transporter [Glycomyces xiaoerkulensis]|uniref:sodium-dependent transporter n=1 Tax=Glycomyces xiaoerkulensis TaxID=2038139 RepID=UPI000C264DDB|nr:sodium-dependent transporter [Glycomyces xiaoerkulensis]
MIRENWGTRVGFILAAIGSAVGLGNIWRFPGVAYENGGGAFLLPYLVALLTAGIPLLIMEFTLGRRYKGSAPVAFRRLNKNAEFIGWWQVAISVIIAVYYAAVIGWAAWFTFYAIGQTWGGDPESFLLSDFLGYVQGDGSVPGIGEFGDWQLGLTAVMIGVWALALLIIAGGVRKGIEVANKIFIPLLVLMFGVLVVQAMTLDGAIDGLGAFFTPQWDTIGNAQVWVAAYGQIFFSLSIGFGIMVTYASYLKRKSDITTSAVTVGLSNSSFELLAGIGVFSVVGYMALQSGTPIDEQVSTGVGLAFIAFPAIINTLPYAAGLFGVLFFASLTIAGMSSLISIVQVPVAAVEDRFGIGRGVATAFIGGGLAVVSIGLFSSANGLIVLDVSDFFINQFGIAVAAPVSIVAVVWLAWKWKELRQDANRTSIYKIGPIWLICLGLITPLILGYMMVQNIVDVFTGSEEVAADYLDNQTYGWSVAGGALAFGVVMALLLRRKSVPDLVDEEEAEGEATPTGGKEESR